MLLGAFTFSGRMGRFNYAINALLLVVVLALGASLAFAVTFALAGSPALMILAGLAALVAAPIVLWVGLALLARRVRDIGWEPRVALPAWLALPVVDRVVAGHPTIIGLGLDLTFLIVLFIMPGEAETTSLRPDNADQPAADIPPG